jgi:hypothetical protein
MSAGQQALAAAGVVLVMPGLGAAGMTNTLPTGNSGSVTMVFNSDGSISKSVGGTGAVGSPTGATQWAAVVVSGIGNSVWIRMSSIVGNTPNGPTIFTALSSNQSFNFALTTSDRSATFNLDFSYDGSNVAQTSAGNSLVITHT